MNNAQATLNQQRATVDSLEKIFFSAVADLQSSLKDPVSVMHQLAHSMTDHQFTHNEFCFLATFCGWESPFNFSNIPTDGLSLLQWFELVATDSDTSCGFSNVGAGLSANPNSNPAVSRDVTLPELAHAEDLFRPDSSIGGSHSRTPQKETM